MRLRRLIEALHERAGERVVVLVDEYDKPILNALEGPARAADERAGAPVAADPQATANRDDLRGLYGTLKDCDAHIERTFPTGVSKFSKVSLFSDPNFLTDSPWTRGTPPSAATPRRTSTARSASTCYPASQSRRGRWRTGSTTAATAP